jgi:hypothetical protein
MSSRYMETTKIDPKRTAQEIVSALVQGGAQQVNQEFKEGRIVGLHWTLLVLSALCRMKESVQKLIQQCQDGE